LLPFAGPEAVKLRTSGVGRDKPKVRLKYLEANKLIFLKKINPFFLE
jgi:hypothetical protein